MFENSHFVCTKTGVKSCEGSVAYMTALGEGANAVGENRYFRSGRRSRVKGCSLRGKAGRAIFSAPAGVAAGAASLRLEKLGIEGVLRSQCISENHAHLLFNLIRGKVVLFIFLLSSMH